MTYLQLNDLISKFNNHMVIVDAHTSLLNYETTLRL